ncbi:MAG: DUF2225 domain-containing protein [Spirochaetaceae bacterium]|jgi:uncharacterized protein (DUF2225 family)|nr:DUF2225 domain-containing protein [Spirochaetaceae bacterium]
MKKDNALKLSYPSKKATVCPACEEKFHKEELLSGSGRLIAGGLTEELHRLYEPSVKYGDVYPLAYQAAVCPNCWFAAMNEDFSLLPDEQRDIVSMKEAERKAELELIFPQLDFHEPRDLFSGAASQYLIMRCYDYYPKQFSPTAKQGLAALRASWMFDEMDKKEPGQHYDWLAMLFKRKARFFYSQALANEGTGTEALSGLKAFGPDTDKNYGYEGFLYITGLLEFKYGERENEEQWKERIASTKRTIAKMFGLGKSSKNKPGPLLEKARNLYDEIAKELEDTDD